MNGTRGRHGQEGRAPVSEAVLGVPPVQDVRRWLLRRIHLEARAYANADSTSKAIRWGRVLGYLEVGTVLGCWTERSAGYAADRIQNRQSLRRLHRVLRMPP